MYHKNAIIYACIKYDVTNFKLLWYYHGKQYHINAKLEAKQNNQQRR